MGDVFRDGLGRINFRRAGTNPFRGKRRRRS